MKKDNMQKSVDPAMTCHLESFKTVEGDFKIRACENQTEKKDKK